MVDGLTFAARTLSSTSQEGAALLLSGGAEDAAGGLYQGDPNRRFLLSKFRVPVRGLPIPVPVFLRANLWIAGPTRPNLPKNSLLFAVSR
jgi:hypothetical protein